MLQKFLSAWMAFTVALATALAAVASLAPAAERARPFELIDGDRVVLLGGTFFERAQRYGYLETGLQLRFPQRRISMRNLGWSGDTVFAESRGIFDAPDKGYARMIDQVRGLKPTVLFLHYGENESFRGEKYLDTFIEQYNRLLDDLAPTGADVVLFSPRRILRLDVPLPDPAAQNQLRQRYGAAIRELARKRGVTFIDLFPLLDAHRHRETGGAPVSQLTEDGLHLTEYGYRLASREFEERLLGPRPERPAAFIHLKADGTVVASRHVDVAPQSSDAEHVSVRAAFADPYWTDCTLVVDGLSEGRYTISVDGHELPRSVTAAELSSDAERDSGLKPFANTFVHEKLRHRVIEKNEMYFHRWRPQNVTYLFLFRKHEQGNNAKEVEEFAAITAELDARLFELKQTAAVPTIRIQLAGR